MLAPVHPMQLVLGLTVWAVWFVIWYTVLSLACEFAPVETASVGWINGLLIIISLPFIAVLWYWARRCWRASRAPDVSGPARFIGQVSAGAHGLAGFAVAFMILPGLALPPCV